MIFIRNDYLSLMIILFIWIAICFSYIRPATAECAEYMWMCDQGSCIEAHEKCDGRVQCPDDSDETAANCMSNSCPDYAFRCANGGCVAGHYKCNNITDCYDSSDELFCDYTPKINIQGRCGSKWQMECVATKECISIQKTCNGIADCRDSSDETVQLCGKRECSVGFRCAYGGCVDDGARCDGRIDCHDASDEAWEMCGYSRPPPSTTTTSTTTTTTSTTTTTTSKPDVDDYSDEDEGLPCNLPTNLTRIVVRFSTTNEIVQGDSLIYDGEHVIATCRGSSKRSYPMCLNGTWVPAFPRCPAFCSTSEINGISTVYRCLLNGAIADARCAAHGVYANTDIDLVCASRYEKEYHGSQIVKCLRDGSYESPRVKCYHTCGRVDSPLEALMKNGIRTEQSKVPWHVAIHSNYKEPSKYICGGSIISPRLIISAAHCFVYDKRTMLPSYFYVVAGKSHTLNETVGREREQIRNISNIYISRHYSTQWPLALKADLSLIKLDRPLIYTSQISAICLLQPLTFPEGATPSGVPGTVSGYGVNSQRLEVLNLNTIDYESCRKLNGADNLPNDKFCVCNCYKNSTLCKGDSGSAFAIKKGNLHYLLGVVSYSPITQNDCASSEVLAISSVRHIEDDLWATVHSGMENDRELF